MCCIAIAVNYVHESPPISTTIAGKLLKSLTLFNSYTMGSSGLPDIYTRSLRAAGPRGEGVHIRQTTRAHGIATM